MRIGIFDSGVGGLTVLKSLYDAYPNNEYIYIGDNLHNPYGDKTKEELYSYATSIIDYFIKVNVELVVIGCNTICSQIYELLKSNYNIPLIGVIDSTIESFIKSNKKSVLVIGTVGTINSNVYEDKIKKINPSIKVKSIKTPLLVPLIEKGLSTKEVIDNYLKPYTDIDSIILGCTHYKLIEKDIPSNIKIIDSSIGVVKELEKYNSKGNSDIKIYTTGNEKDFNKLCIPIMSQKGIHLDL